jgi:hypothetical protein
VKTWSAKRWLEKTMKKLTIIALLAVVFVSQASARQYPDRIMDAQLKHLAFSNAPIHTAVAEVQKQVMERQEESIFWDRLEGIVVHESLLDATVSIDTTHTTLSKFLKNLEARYRIQYWRDESFIFLSSESAAPVMHRAYDVLAHLFPKSTTEQADVTPVFIKQGIHFPDGAGATYYRSCGKLIIANTPAQIRDIEKLISVLNVLPYQVCIETHLVRRSSQYTKLQAGAHASGDDELKQLLADGEHLLGMETYSQTGCSASNSLSVVPEDRRRSDTAEFGFRYTPIVGPVGHYIQLDIEGGIALSDKKGKRIVFQRNERVFLESGNVLVSRMTSRSDNGFTLLLIHKVYLVSMNGKECDRSRSRIDASIVKKFLREVEDETSQQTSGADN